jgi:predicted component of type VI protein secretion system
MSDPMPYICRLFHRDRPFEPIESRIFAQGRMTIGRDSAADWRIDDAEGVLSRIHCTLRIDEGQVWLQDDSTNGTFLDHGVRAGKDEAVALEDRQSIHLGAFSILIERMSDDVRPDTFSTNLHVPLSAAPAKVPEGWTDLATTRGPHPDASLIDAFCEGAKLDASALSSEDPADLMRRVGAIYQQTVLGLATLMADRTRMKGEHDLERTTINARRNNPFKWSPTRRLAQDLLKAQNGAFLSDAEAVRASFEDLSRHMAAVAVGADAAIEVVVNTLSPGDIEVEARRQASLLRGRAVACWDVHNRRHAALSDGEGAASVKQAFAQAYGRSVSQT